MTLAYLVYLGLTLALVAAWALPSLKLSVGVEAIDHATKQAAAISILLFTVVIGLRYNVGGDYFGYIDYFRFTRLDDTATDVVFEPGFLLLIQLLKLFDLPEQSIIVASSFLQIGLFSLWLRRHPQVAPFAVFGFMTLVLLDVNNIVRQGIAFFAVLLALSAVAERRWAAFIGWGLFAYAFHRSALIIFPIGAALAFAPLPRMQLQAAALLFSYAFIGLFFDRIVSLFTLLSSIIGYSGYGDVTRADLAFAKGGAASLNLGVYLWPIVDFVIIIFSQRIDDHYQSMRYRLYHNFFLVSALLQPVANAWDFLPFARGLFYFTATRSICVGFVLHYCLVVSRRPREIVIGIGMILVFLTWLIVAVSRGAAWSAPYQFY